MKLFDSHFHIIAPPFPLQDNQGYRPDFFTCADYLERLAGYALAGGAVVSGSFQGFDQSYLRAALRTLGPGYVGVTQLPASVSDEEILDLHRAGVRGVRFNLRRGGSESLDRLSDFAQRIFELAGWHVELYVDSRELGDLRHRLGQLPAVSIAHLGLSAEGLPYLLELAEQGVMIKASGFGRVDFDIAAALRDISRANPAALTFGTDLPGTRCPQPFRDADFLLVRETLGDQLAARIFYDNAIAFYQP